jgi:hypothetical protein
MCIKKLGLCSHIYREKKIITIIITRGVSHYMALPVYIKKYLKAKEEL